MQKKIVTLDNGLRIVLMTKDVYTVNAAITVKAGMLNETDAENGISHFLEHMAFKGTKTKTAKELIDYNTPTCMNSASRLTKKYAIKTGTTNTDHLIFGYNKDAILGIWMGYDDNKETDVKEGSTMKIIWAEVMEEYLKNKEDKWYDKPNNIVGTLVNPITGKIATDEDKNKKILYYIKGTQPLSEENENLIPTMKIE